MTPNFFTKIQQLWLYVEQIFTTKVQCKYETLQIFSGFCIKNQQPKYQSFIDCH